MKALMRFALPAALVISSIAIAPAALADDIQLGTAGCSVSVSTGTVVIGPNGVTFSEAPHATWDTTACLDKFEFGSTALDCDVPHVYIDPNGGHITLPGWNPMDCLRPR